MTVSDTIAAPVAWSGATGTVSIANAKKLNMAGTMTLGTANIAFTGGATQTIEGSGTLSFTGGSTNTYDAATAINITTDIALVGAGTVAFTAGANANTLTLGATGSDMTTATGAVVLDINGDDAGDDNLLRAGSLRHLGGHQADRSTAQDQDNILGVDARTVQHAMRCYRRGFAESGLDEIQFVWDAV